MRFELMTSSSSPIDDKYIYLVCNCISPLGCWYKICQSPLPKLGLITPTPWDTTRILARMYVQGFFRCHVHVKLIGDVCMAGLPLRCMYVCMAGLPCRPGRRGIQVPTGDIICIYIPGIYTGRRVTNSRFCNLWGPRKSIFRLDMGNVSFSFKILMEGGEIRTHGP